MINMTSSNTSVVKFFNELLLVNKSLQALVNRVCVNITHSVNMAEKCENVLNVDI